MRIEAAIAGVTASPRKTRPNRGGLHRLGFDIGVDDHERALVHRGEHQRCGRDLRQRPIHHPGPVDHPRPRQRLAACEQHDGEEEEREWEAEQEAHMRRPGSAERRSELALGGVPHGLARRGDEREQRPEQALLPPLQQNSGLSSFGRSQLMTRASPP